MSGHPRVTVSEMAAVYNAGEDTIAFCLEPETLPVFWAWMNKRGQIREGFTAEMMKQDMETILSAIRARPRVRVVP